MITMTGSAWRRQGSTLVTRLASITGLLEEAANSSPITDHGVKLTSLRSVLRWIDDGWPEHLPGVASVAINGLDAVLDRCTESEAAAFLRNHVKRIIRTSQRHWTATGLLFLLPVQPARITVDLDERICYRLPAGGTVAISQHLWNGAGRDVREVRCPGVKDQEIVGYHVAHLS